MLAGVSQQVILKHSDGVIKRAFASFWCQPSPPLSVDKKQRDKGLRNQHWVSLLLCNHSYGAGWGDFEGGGF